jgi:uroporphyrinogen decarboxylase
MALNKREALQRYLSGDAADGYVPAGFFLHFGEDYKCGQAAIQRHKEFFEFTGMDFVKIQFELPFPRREIESCSDYLRLPSLPLEYYRPQLDVVKGLVAALKSEALVILTLYSPFMIAGQMVGNGTVIEHMELDPEPVFKGIEAITESLIEFVRECRKIGLDGFYHSTQGGEARRFKDPETFTKWIKPTDLRLMNEIDLEFPFNILHICDYHSEYGGYADLKPFSDYPGTVVNVSTEIGAKHASPAELSNHFGRPYLGGLNRLGPLSKGTVEDARAAAQTVLADAPPKFILGADCTVPATTPWENLRAAIDVAHSR